MFAMPTARLARTSDLPSLLALFEVSEVSAAAQPRKRAESIWRDTLAQRGAYVFVSDDGDRIAATCMLVTAPNLLREGRRHGFLEKVASHPELRGQGHGKAVVQAALAHAWTVDCHHVLMQSAGQTQGSTGSTRHWGSSRGFALHTSPAGRRAALPGCRDGLLAYPMTR
jgi:GNAT superfamily N-acetyltransferase